MFDLHSFLDLILILAIHGGQDDLSENADCQQEKWHPKEEEDSVVVVRWDHRVWQHGCRLHCKHAVQSISEVFEALVDGHAVHIHPIEVVEDHGGDPCKKNDCANLEYAHRDDGSGHLDEGCNHGTNPGNRHSKPKSNERGYSDPGSREERSGECVAESNKDHDVVENEFGIRLVSATNTSKVGVKLRQKGDANKNNTQEEVFYDQPIADRKKGNTRKDDLCVWIVCGTAALLMG
mmetsp:Transcript_21869/g.46715  ORF Transcript_21869/g.46715 Transcript_21869/m.46715 type:complete len:235 (+) Transcript_21869:1519-2223(+)